MRELIEQREQLVEGAIPAWVRSAAKSKVIEGPNGNKAIAYEWKWTWSEEEGEYEGGGVGKKVSDWDEALTCASCGRRIVHVYWVEDMDGEIKPYGGDHLHVALGYPREISKAKLQKIQAKVTRLEQVKKEEKGLRDRYERMVAARAAPDISAANMLFSNSGAKARMPGTFLYNKKDKLVMRADDLATERFMKYVKGWKVGRPVEIRKVLDA